MKDWRIKSINGSWSLMLFDNELETIIPLTPEIFKKVVDELKLKPEELADPSVDYSKFPTV